MEVICDRWHLFRNESQLREEMKSDFINGQVVLPFDIHAHRGNFRLMLSLVPVLSGVGTLPELPDILRSIHPNRLLFTDNEPRSKGPAEYGQNAVSHENTRLTQDDYRVLLRREGDRLLAFRGSHLEHDGTPRDVKLGRDVTSAVYGNAIKLGYGLCDAANPNVSSPSSSCSSGTTATRNKGRKRREYLKNCVRLNVVKANVNSTQGDEVMLIEHVLRRRLEHMSYDADQAVQLSMELGKYFRKIPPSGIDPVHVVKLRAELKLEDDGGGQSVVVAYSEAISHSPSQGFLTQGSLSAPYYSSSSIQRPETSQRTGSASEISMETATEHAKALEEAVSGLSGYEQVSEMIACAMESTNEPTLEQEEHHQLAEFDDEGTGTATEHAKALEEAVSGLSGYERVSEMIACAMESTNEPTLEQEEHHQLAEFDDEGTGTDWQIPPGTKSGQFEKLNVTPSNDIEIDHRTYRDSSIEEAIDGTRDKTIAHDEKNEYEALTEEDISSVTSADSTFMKTEEQYSIYFDILGLSREFFHSFYSRKSSDFGHSESDLGWIHLMVEEMHEEVSREELESMSTALGLEALGYSSEMAEAYGDFIDNSVYKGSEDILGWALLQIDNSGLFDYPSGYFVETPNHGNGGSSNSNSNNSTLGYRPDSTYRNGLTAKFIEREVFGKGVSMKISEFEQMVEEAPVKEKHSLWFHATTSKSANGIIKYGIDLDRGRARRDFSTIANQSRTGFYICSKAITARSYCQQRHPCPVSVIIFQLEDDFKAALGENGLDLRFEYNVERLGKPNEESVDQEDPWKTSVRILRYWEKVILHYRCYGRTYKASDLFDSYDYIVGPCSDNALGPTLCRPLCDGDQLCIKSTDLAEKLHSKIVDVIHFTQPSRSVLKVKEPLQGEEEREYRRNPNHQTRRNEHSLISSGASFGSRNLTAKDDKDKTLADKDLLQAIEISSLGGLQIDHEYGFDLDLSQAD